MKMVLQYSNFGLQLYNAVFCRYRQLIFEELYLSHEISIADNLQPFEAHKNKPLFISENK